jgi:tyrosyl-tRNA synthetase
MTMPLLEGLDGVNKMSKSLGNYIGITDAPNDMFGKIMSISDDLMWRYFELLSFRPLVELNRFKQDVAQGANPRDLKFLLAEELIERFHSRAAAIGAREDFIGRFQKGAMPDEMPEISLSTQESAIPIARLLKDAGLVASTSEAVRMIQQGGVKIDGEKLEDRSLLIKKGITAIFQVGKRKFAKVSIGE